MQVLAALLHELAGTSVDPFVAEKLLPSGVLSRVQLVSNHAVDVFLPGRWSGICRRKQGAGVATHLHNLCIILVDNHRRLDRASWIV